MLEQLNNFWDKTQEFFIFCIFISLIIHFIRQRQKYKHVPREISSKLWFEVYLMHSSVKVIIEDQMLSIEKAKSMLLNLEDIKTKKQRLDQVFPFSRKLDDFDEHLDQYMVFLQYFIAQYQSQVQQEQNEMLLPIQDKNALHLCFKKELKILEKELWPVSQ